LDLVARINRAAPVIFIDTRMLFQETLDYKAELIRTLGLTDVRTISPEGHVIRETDPWGRMHQTNPDACCDFRKTRVLQGALAEFDGWITGRKRFQAFTRGSLQPVERQKNGKTKINPLADWTADDLAEYAEHFDLPQHPLVSQGYPSIGCASCTSRVSAGEDARAGRWRDLDKVECGIHFENGKIVRTGATPND
ncbi:MAG: phosphoadenylyl-sulfate reductase, partial [Pseudomonadota bacterium]